MLLVMIRVMKKYRVVFGVASTVIILTLLGWLLASSASRYDILQPMGDIAMQQRNLLYFALLLCAVVVIPVFAMLVGFAWKYREGGDKHNRKKTAYKPEWAHNTWLEVVWWGIPIIIIAVLAVVTWQTSHSLDPYRPIVSDRKAIKVQVVALQWKWLFIYPELGVATLNQLPVPVGTPVHFTLTADAPMSAFWIPTLGSQIYNMNGMSSQLNLIADHTGDFPGYTTNINGEGYARMKFMVHSRTQAEFDTWVKKAAASPRMMDTAEYEKLVKPETITEERDYMLMDTHLYDTIIDKYMMPMDHSKSVEYTAPMDHSMHNMGDR